MKQTNNNNLQAKFDNKKKMCLERWKILIKIVA